MAPVSRKKRTLNQPQRKKRGEFRKPDSVRMIAEIEAARKNPRTCGCLNDSLISESFTKAKEKRRLVNHTFARNTNRHHKHTTLACGVR